MKCKRCHTHPLLTQSGWPQPKDLKCPVCDDFYDSKTGRRTIDLKEEEIARKEQHDKDRSEFLRKRFEDGLKKIRGGIHR